MDQFKGWGRVMGMKSSAAILLSLPFAACMRSDPIAFDEDGLGFQISSILKSGAEYKFLFSLEDKSTYGPVAKDSIAWNLSIEGRDSAVIFHSDSKPIVGRTHSYEYTISAASFPFLTADKPYPVIVSVEFLSKGKSIRKDTLHSFLEADPNQLLDSNFLAVISGYTQVDDNYYDSHTIQMYGNHYYYRYIFDDSTFRKDYVRHPGYFFALKISGADSTYRSHRGYYPLRRSFDNKGEVSDYRDFDDDAGMPEDSLVFESWTVFDRKYFHTRDILWRNKSEN